MLFRSNSSFFKDTNPQITITAHNNYQKTINVAFSSNYPPYTYIDKNNNQTGYYFELMNAIANDLNYNVKYHTTNWPGPLNALINGDVDLVPGMEYRTAYYDKFLLSEPVYIDQFIAYGKKDYTFINELIDGNLGIIEYSPAKNLILKSLGIQEIGRANV